MKRNYLSVIGASDQDFLDKKVDLSSDKSATLSDAKDVARIENILDLQEGLLRGRDFYLSKAECDCGRTLTFYDFIFTALVEQWHDPSLIVHTLVGRKNILNEPRPLRCSDCGSTYATASGIVYFEEYETHQYGCCKEHHL